VGAAGVREDEVEGGHVGGKEGRNGRRWRGWEW
jgi:hypothetical protein